MSLSRRSLLRFFGVAAAAPVAVKVAAALPAVEAAPLMARPVITFNRVKPITSGACTSFGEMSPAMIKAYSDEIWAAFRAHPSHDLLHGNFDPGDRE